jgi:hypothetical protein
VLLARLVNGDLTFADDLKLIPGHNDRRAFVNADSQQFRKLIDDRNEIALAIPLQQVLVDRRVLEQSHAFFVAGSHHKRVAFARPADQVGTLDRRAR